MVAFNGLAYGTWWYTRIHYMELKVPHSWTQHIVSPPRIHYMELKGLDIAVARYTLGCRNPLHGVESHNTTWYNWVRWTIHESITWSWKRVVGIIISSGIPESITWSWKNSGNNVNPMAIGVSRNPLHGVERARSGAEDCRIYTRGIHYMELKVTSRRSMLLWVVALESITWSWKLSSGRPSRRVR